MKQFVKLVVTVLIILNFHSGECEQHICTSNNSCGNITCTNQNETCQINCEGIEACQDSYIDCGNSDLCSIDCNGLGACKNAYVDGTQSGYFRITLNTTTFSAIKEKVIQEREFLNLTTDITYPDVYNQDFFPWEAAPGIKIYCPTENTNYSNFEYSYNNYNISRNCQISCKNEFSDDPNSNTCSNITIYSIYGS